MDFASLIGIIVGLVAVFAGQMLESGEVSISLFHPAAALIVFGGTLGALMLNFPFRIIWTAILSVKKAFVPEDVNYHEMIEEIITLSEITRREGSLALEQVVPNVHNPFLRKGVQLIADSTNPRIITDILNKQIDHEEEVSLLCARVFEAAGGFAPTFGIVGAVLGLIQVMQNISDTSKLGYGIATAFIATVYGVGIANLILLPLGGKIRIKAREDIIVKEMLLDGVLSIHSGENPSVIYEKLYSYLTHKPEVLRQLLESPQTAEEWQ